MNLPTHFNELQTLVLQKHTLETLIPLLRKQLTKDLERTGIVCNILFQRETTVWQSELSHLLSGQTTSVKSQLCYLIDVPENLFSTHLENNELLAELILYRELVKIYYQLSYR